MDKYDYWNDNEFRVEVSRRWGIGDVGCEIYSRDTKFTYHLILKSMADFRYIYSF